MCFDLDGVLLDTMPLHAKAWQRALNQQGIPVLRREIYLWEGEPGLVTAARMMHREHRDCSRRDCLRLLRQKEDWFSRLAQPVRVRPLWIRLLDWLGRHHLRLGLVTGTSQRELRHLVAPAILHRFHVIVTGDTVRRGKPAPDPYRKAFARLRTHPQRVIVIENAPYGIRSARRAKAGFIIGLTSSLSAQHLREADVVRTSPRAVFSMVRRQLNLTGKPADR